MSEPTAQLAAKAPRPTAWFMLEHGERDPRTMTIDDQVTYFAERLDARSIKSDTTRFQDALRQARDGRGLAGVNTAEPICTLAHSSLGSVVQLYNGQLPFDPEVSRSLFELARHVAVDVGDAGAAASATKVLETFDERLDLANRMFVGGNAQDIGRSYIRLGEIDEVCGFLSDAQGSYFSAKSYAGGIPGLRAVMTPVWRDAQRHLDGLQTMSATPTTEGKLVG